MATNMTPKGASKRMIPLADLAAGERIKIQILKADNTLKEELCDDDVPTGKTGKKVSISYNVELE